MREMRGHVREQLSRTGPAAPLPVIWIITSAVPTCTEAAFTQRPRLAG